MPDAPSLWTQSCENCGAPASISLAHPDEVRCPACGDVRPPSEALAHRLRAGQDALDTLEAADRQLNASRRRAVSGADHALWIFVIGVAVLLMMSPVYLCGGVMGLINGDQESTAFGCACTNMLLSLLVATPMLFGRMRTARRSILAACSAEPPLVEGAAHRCHLCGGDLEAGPATIVRCGYCDADNVVHAEVIDAHATTVHAHREDLAEGIREAAEQLRASHGATNLLVAVVIMWTFHTVMALPTLGVAALLLWLVHG